MKIRFLPLLLLPLAVSAHAQYQLTYTATAETTSHGYIAGNTYTFSFMTGTTFSPQYSSSASSAGWRQHGDASEPLYTSISGTGLAGTFAPPPTPDYYLFLTNTSIETDTTVNGLTLLDGTGIYDIDPLLKVTGTNLTFPGPEDAITAIAPLAGRTFTSSGNSQLAITTTGFSTLDFQLQSLTISGSAVPELPTTAGVVGAMALGFVIYQRRRRTLLAGHPAAL